MIATVDDVWHGYIGNPSLRRYHQHLLQQARPVRDPAKAGALMEIAQRIAASAIPRPPSRHQIELRKMETALRGGDSDYITGY
jgi:hypothetical protein